VRVRKVLCTGTVVSSLWLEYDGRPQDFSGVPAPRAEGPAGQKSALEFSRMGRFLVTRAGPWRVGDLLYRGTRLPWP
jgi:hypothetical protein